MQAAPIAELPRFPAIGGTCLIALGVFAIAAPEQVEPLTLDLRGFWAEPWRLLTPALVHAGQLQSERSIEGLVHVGFNCYWLWKLGTGVEERIGHLATLALIALFAVAGNLLEYACLGPAVGLSGVVYGFVALIWTLGRRSAVWRDMIDARTARFFVVWFLLCVAATITGAFPIANFAHAGGALFGALLGWTMSARGGRQLGALATTLAALALFVAGASVGRPWVNFSARAGLDAMALAERAMAEHDVERAIAWAERGVGYRRTPADHYAYLSWLYFNAERFAEARDALAEACRREPDNEGYRETLAQFEALAE